MQILIKSAGFGPRHDYRWKVEEGGRDAAQVLRRVSEVEHLVDDRNFSLILCRDALRISILLVKSLPSERRDFAGTRLRNSVAISVPSSNEGQVRAIASRALAEPEWFAGEVDALIKDDANEQPYGFHVDFGGMRARLLSVPVPEGGNHGISAARFGSYDAKELWQDLAAQIQGTEPPDEFDTPILITKDATPSTFHGLKVWRGLCGCFESKSWVEREKLESSVDTPETSDLGGPEPPALELARVVFRWITDRPIVAAGVAIVVGLLVYGMFGGDSARED